MAYSSPLNLSWNSPKSGPFPRGSPHAMTGPCGYQGLASVPQFEITLKPIPISALHTGLA